MLYIISGVYISICSISPIFSRRKSAYYQRFFARRDATSNQPLDEMCGEDISFLSPARLRLSSATLLSRDRPFPRNAPSAELLMGECT